MKRRLASLLLVLAMCLTLLPVQAFAADAAKPVDTANPFEDVKQGSWYYDAVQYVRVNGLFYGTSKTTFWPEGTMTRGMFVTVLGRMAGVAPDNYTGSSAFTDVAENAYYAPYVMWAAKYGVTVGTGDGKFSPDAYINRQQMAVFFVRYFETFHVDYETNANITTTPADIDSVSPWARDAVLKLWRTGLLAGSGGNFDPMGNAARAQVATICYRTDEAVATWYSEPGVASTRVRINPATGLPYDNGSKPADPPKPSGGGTTPTPVPSPDPDPTASPDPDPTASLDPDPTASPDPDPTASPDPDPTPTPGDSYCVDFYDGSKLIKSFQVEKDEPLGQLPTVAESSKAGYILEGYYTDSDFTTPFYAGDPVTGDLSVYAKYESMGEAEALTVDSFARMDQDRNVSFRFKALGGTADSLDAAKAAVSLAVKDGTDPVEITVSGSGIYTVSAPSGFNPGCSYELNLAEGWTFLPDGSDTIPSEAIRTAAFSIEMQEVENLSMNEGIRYVQDTNQINYTYTDSSDQSHTVAELASDADITKGGSFNYTETTGWQTGDILCIYVGAQPDDGDDNTKTEEAIYAKVKQIDSGTVQFEPLSAEDQMRLYDIPDNFPIKVDELPDGDTGTVSINALDTATYALMVSTGDNTVEKAKEKLGVGDFVTLYTSADTIAGENDVYFGEIAAVDGETITYKKTTAEVIQDSANLYKTVDIENTDMVTPAEAQEIQRIVQAQVEQSDFAEEAAYALADMATQTNGFRESMGVMSFTAIGEDGEPLSDAELASYNGLMQLDGDDDDDDGVEVKVAVVLDPDKLHFGSKGVQLAVQVDAKFKVDAKDGEVHFDLSATFVQEAAVDPRVKGELVYKEVLGFIPAPTGVQVNAIVDVKSYTAMSLRADIYTVAEEEKSIWEQFKAFTKDPSTLADIPGLPDGLTDGLKTVGDAIDKIEETKAKIDKGLEDANKLKSDLEALWSVVEASAQNGLTKETYENACETLGKTNVAGELMEMLHLSDEEISAEYINGLDELMDKYSELLEKETDWVQLVDAEMFSASTPPEFGVMVGVRGSFVVRADINITLGTNLEYEVGKRYNFWFRVGLFKPTSGSSTMDLIDEHFAFQFYVMGKLGLKTGVRLKLYAAIGSVDAISVGISTELGPYVKLWGFFIYDYSKYRPARTQNWVYKEQMAGALYLEFGLYLMVSVDVKALFLEQSNNLLDKEFPLLDAGDKYFYYDTAYEPLDDKDEIVVYNNGTVPLQSGCAVSMELPEDTYALRCMDLTTGRKGARSLSFDNYTFKVSNPNFRVDNVNGKPVISVVTIPQNIRSMSCDLTITYKNGKMAFSTFDMTTTVHLVWTNMTAAEYQQVYTASVTIPDGNGGQEVIWSRRVRKGTSFDLPTEEELKSLLSWSDAKYVAGTGYGSQQTEGVTLIENTQYAYNLGYQTYQLTVTGIEGGAGSQTFTGKYGDPFDFSSLANTGKDGPGEYTRFAGLIMDGESLSLNQPINGKFAASNNAAATAQYVDDTVTATFEFTGITHEPIQVKLRRGGTPDISGVEAAIPEDGAYIAGYYPKVGPMESDTVYQVVCNAPGGDTPTPDSVTITFQDFNNVTMPEPITRIPGSPIGTLPVPVREGYDFKGWLYNNNFVDVNTVVPEGGMTLTANWIRHQVTVTFDTNGAPNLPESDTTKKFGYNYSKYKFPDAEWSGHYLLGWYTEREGGTQVTTDMKVTTYEDHTLYARWKEVDAITDPFSFTNVTATYDKQPHAASYTFTQSGNCPAQDSFTIDYVRVQDQFSSGNESVGANAPTTAGTYNVHITRPADENYAKFDQTYTNVLVINRASRTLGQVDASDITIANANLGLSSATASLDISVITDKDLSSNAKAAYTVNVAGNTYVYEGQKSLTRIYDLQPGKTYTISKVGIVGDINYEDAYAAVSKTFTTKSAPPDMSDTTNSWADESNCDTSWWNPNQSEFKITNEAELAGLSRLSGFNNFEGKTFILTALSYDMSTHYWGGLQSFNGTLTSRIPNHPNDKSVIKGLYYDATGLYDEVGFVNELLDGGVIENIVVDGYFVPHRYNSSTILPHGGIAAVAKNGSTIRNCESNVTIYIDGKTLIDNKDIRICGSTSGNVTVENCTARDLPKKK